MDLGSKLLTGAASGLVWLAGCGTTDNGVQNTQSQTAEAYNPLSAPVLKRRLPKCKRYNPKEMEIFEERVLRSTLATVEDAIGRRKIVYGEVILDIDGTDEDRLPPDFDVVLLFDLRGAKGYDFKKKPINGATLKYIARFGGVPPGVAELHFSPRAQELLKTNSYFREIIVPSYFHKRYPKNLPEKGSEAAKRLAEILESRDSEKLLPETSRDVKFNPPSLSSIEQ